MIEGRLRCFHAVPKSARSTKSLSPGVAHVDRVLRAPPAGGLRPRHHSRSCARTRLSLGDAPDLLFKGFLLREAGRFGAAENAYASFYLWRSERAFAEFVTDGRFRVVTDSFGRPSIEVQILLDTRKGRASTAGFIRLETVDIAADADLEATFAREIACNREAAGRPGVLVAAVSVDPAHWKVTRTLVSEHEPKDGGAGTVYQVRHLARPLLDTLEASG
ncbi:DUF4865 family protein [Burkholderia diffusa]|uniref:DUF4865 family protein n=1 Tax=Burkholderia diffusa TaxID=488732 RepID=UPI000A4E72E4|nr:DUF4865 family protein [Burkholderia diffusa]